MPSGAKCSYFLCSKTRRNTPGLSVFAFPVKNPVLCQEWVINSGNAELLHLSHEQLKKRFICKDHFTKNHLLGRKLTQNAVPIPYVDVDLTVKIPEKTFGMAKAIEFEEQFAPQPSCSHHQELHILTPKKRKVVCIEESTSELESIDRIITMRSAPKRRPINTDNKTAKGKIAAARSLKNLPSFPRALTTMQIYHRARTPWSAEEKKTALGMYYKGPAMYKFLRQKGVVLPSPSTIINWIKKYDWKPGLNKKLLKGLAIKTDTMSAKHRECVLMFDEMAIKRALEYSNRKDVVEGFEDLGELGRKPVVAKQVLVFLVRGIYSNWKIPISFYFSEKGISAAQLDVILKQTLVVLNDLRINIISIICDQSTTNQKLFKVLHVTHERPYFEYHGKKYYCIFDAPHLVKSIRNNLLDSDFFINDKRISFNHIKQVYALDKASATGKALPKITDTHIAPNSFQKMSVKLATQVLSGSMSAAIYTAVECKQISPLAKHTAEFIKIINNAFDALNSRSLSCKNLCNVALSDNSQHAFNALKDAYKELQNTFKVKNNIKKRPPCFDGLLQTINAVLEIYKQQKAAGYTFLLTSRLNQDILENQFSIYRQKGGYSRNPTVRTFQAAYQQNCIYNLMKPPKSSAYEEAYEARNLLQECSISDSHSLSDISEDSSYYETGSSSSTCSDMQETLEMGAVKYFAGYLYKKCDDKFHCSVCKVELSSSDELTNVNDILIFYKNYNINDPVALKRPTDLLFNVTKKGMKYFPFLYDKYKDKRHVLQNIFKRVYCRVEKNCPEWHASPCDEHRRYILNLLIKVLLYKKCKFASTSFKSYDKTSQKLRILSE